MKTARYRSLEKAIVAHDGGGMWERWRYGRMLLVDDEKTTPAGHLRNGVSETLMAAATKAGIKLNESEIQRRLRAAKTYPCEDQFRHLVTEFETWKDLCMAGFPERPAPPGARPYDPRQTPELTGDRRGQRLLEGTTQLSLFVQDPETVLDDLGRWLDEQDEITQRFAELGVKRRLEFAELVKAVDGDLARTLGEARAALAEMEVGR